MAADTAFAAGALALSVATVGLWFHAMRAVKMWRWRRALQLGALISTALAIAALATSASAGVTAAAIAALLGPASFLGLELIAYQPKRQVAVSVGEPILDFEAPGADGEPFALSSLRGRPFLLKFYRGHW